MLVPVQCSCLAWFSTHNLTATLSSWGLVSPWCLSGSTVDIWILHSSPPCVHASLPWIYIFIDASHFSLLCRNMKFFLGWAFKSVWGLKLKMNESCFWIIYSVTNFRLRQVFNGITVADDFIERSVHDIGSKRLHCVCVSACVHARVCLQSQKFPGQQSWNTARSC